MANKWWRIGRPKPGTTPGGLTGVPTLPITPRLVVSYVTPRQEILAFEYNPTTDVWISHATGLTTVTKTLTETTFAIGGTNVLRVEGDNFRAVTFTEKTLGNGGSSSVFEADIPYDSDLTYEGAGSAYLRFAIVSRSVPDTLATVDAGGKLYTPFLTEKAALAGGSVFKFYTSGVQRAELGVFGLRANSLIEGLT